MSTALVRRHRCRKYVATSDATGDTTTTCTANATKNMQITRIDGRYGICTPHTTDDDTLASFTRESSHNDRMRAVDDAPSSPESP
jgi:hypothetical protein